MSPSLYYNGHIIDPRNRRSGYTALLANHGVIEKLYTRKPRIKNHIRHIDLHGHYMIPGFIDSHTHLISRGIELQRIDLAPCRSLDACLAKLHAEKRTRNILFASNWDESSWPSYQEGDLTKETLDRISRTQPIIMRRVCGHCAVVNTIALQKIPDHYRIVDQKTGWLYEDAALYLNEIFPPNKDMQMRAIELGSQEAHSLGITSIHEIGDLKRLLLLQTAQRNGKLRLRVAFYVLLYDMPEIMKARLISGFGDPLLRFAGIKVFMDGSIGARTAATSIPYKGSQKRGKILLARDRLTEIVKEAEKSSLQLMIHSIGDRTTHTVLSILQQYIPSNNPLRHRLEHIELLNARSIKILARMHLIASMQPNFVVRWQQSGGMYERYLGDRYKNLNCFNVLRKAGVRIAFGSDSMPAGPLYGLKGACEHPTIHHRLTRAQAMICYTLGGAYATSEEHIKGNIRPGMYADFVITNANPLTVKHLDSVRILMTIINGVTVYCQKP